MRKALVFGINQEVGSNLCHTLIKNDWEVIGVVKDNNTEAPILSNLTLVEMGSEELDFLYDIAADVDTLFVHLAEAANHDFIFSMSQIITLAETLKLQLVITTNKYEIRKNWLPSLAFWSKKQPLTIYLPKKLINQLNRASQNGANILVMCCGHSLSCMLDNGYLGMLIKEKNNKVIIQSPGPNSLEHYWTFAPDLANNLVQHLGDYNDSKQPALNIIYYPGHRASMRDIARCLELSSGKPVSVMPLQWTVMEIIALFSPLFRRFLRMRTLWQQGAKPPAFIHCLKINTGMVHTPLELALQRSWQKQFN